MKENEYKIDKQDAQIINFLHIDGRMSFKDIAQELNVSVATIHNRYKNLVKHNILHVVGWTDVTKNGYNGYSRVLIEVKPMNLLENVVEELMKLDEIPFMALISGQYSIEVDVVCKDNSDLAKILHTKIINIKGVNQTDITQYFDILQDNDLPISIKNE
ncbi:MAG: Lrp/AsnC family transcriptional regulator [Flavobacteriales bacterium]|nr:Lrp/AsnC family transcriptional regulator [Flavobacteriales bacterium]